VASRVDIGAVTVSLGLLNQGDGAGTALYGVYSTPNGHIARKGGL
jgi:hypothetical protein